MSQQTNPNEVKMSVETKVNLHWKEPTDSISVMATREQTTKSVQLIADKLKPLFGQMVITFLDEMVKERQILANKMKPIEPVTEEVTTPLPVAGYSSEEHI